MPGLRTLVLTCLALAGAAAAAADLFDPLRPPGASAAVTAPARPAPPRPRARDWTLQSTLVGPGRRSAVIDGRVVVPGDALDGARVLRIEPGRVLLEAGGRRLQLRARNPVRKQPRQAGDS